jgi:ribosomal protein L21
MIDKAFIDKFIDKIIITPIDKNSVKLDVKILTGQVVESSLKRHTGQTSNNICPVRHFQYERKCRREVGHKQIFTYNIAFCIL